MAHQLSYHEQEDRKIYLKLRELLKELPEYCRTYFRGIEPHTQSRTRLAYAYDLTVFFNYVINEFDPMTYKGLSPTELPLDVLDRITAQDIEEYM